MKVPVTIVIPDVVPYLLAVLGLLVIWLYYQKQLKAGAVQGTDIFSRRRFRLFIHLTPNDEHACAACRGANGIAFLPTKHPFAPLHNPCPGCRCLSVGLYGGWPEAQHLITRLKAMGGSPPMLPLNDDDIRDLLAGPWEDTISGSIDRCAIHMLEAVRLNQDPAATIERYRFIIEQAKSDDQYLRIPAYLHLSGLLENQAQLGAALAIVKDFEKAYQQPGQKSPSPTYHQLELMSSRRQRLHKALSSIGQ
jgi:hypothetical protein